MSLYAAIMRLSSSQDKAVIIKAVNLSDALAKVDTMRGSLIAIAPLVSKETYMDAVENVYPRLANSK